MLVRTFRKNVAATPVLLFVAGFFLWSDAFLFFRNLSFESARSEPLFALLWTLVAGRPLLNVSVAFLLLMMQVFLLNYLVQANNLLGKPSWLPGFLYLVLMSSDPYMLSLNPVLCANFFLLIALVRAMSSYGEDEKLREVFNVGLLVAIAGLFYFPAMAFFFWLVLMLAVYYLLSMRGIFAAFIGFVTPFFFLFTWYYLTDQLHERIQGLPEPGLPLQIASQTYSSFSVVMMIFMAVLSFVALMRVMAVYITDKPVRIRKRFRVLLLFFVFSMVSALVGNVHFEVHHSLMMIPLSVFVAVLFSEIRKKWVPELVLYLLLGLVIAGKVLNFI